MRRNRIQLKKRAIDQLQFLKDKGCRISFIARYTSITFGAHRTTAYRHVSDNHDAYTWREGYRRERLEELIRNQDRDEQICMLLSQGYNTAQIAGMLGMNLTLVNRTACVCRKRFPEHFEQDKLTRFS